MKQWHEMAAELERYIRPATFPLAVQLPRTEEEIPAKARRPLRDMGKKLAPCQAAALARKYGWTVAVSASESGCAIASHTHGWEPADPDGVVTFFMYMKYAHDEASAKAGMAAMPAIEPGSCAAVVHAPLARTVFEPDVILLYINPAQLMRLIHGATQETGGPIVSSFSGRAASCSEGVVRAFRDNAPQIVVPGNGDRVWASAQDDEMAFALPASMLDGLLRGLERTHERGVRYPVPACLDYEPRVRLNIPLTDIFKNPVL
ncbi:MAG: DUF169 domain-containing protein [Proteobacteria bacterium]|nr:DUF169 domain-containing protein [Pseudomonadota bacterium]